MEMNIKKIWESLGDELSKEIFTNRFLYLSTGDAAFLQKTALTTEYGRQMYSQMKKAERLVIFGAGEWGHSIKETYVDFDFLCFVDNDEKRTGSSRAGLPVISFHEYLHSYKDALVVIASRIYNEEMERQLIENGISKDNILNAGKMLDELSIVQYFDFPTHQPGLDEAFVDAGCLDGKTSVLFTKWCENQYTRIYAFEPDIRNHARCKKTFQDYGIENYEIIGKGLWNQADSLCFTTNNNGTSSVAESGSETIEVDSLDHMISENEKITFIKMDIEGSELNALNGSRRTIGKDLPVLAVSVYHKPQDIIEIPDLVLRINEEYTLYLRHYSICGNETVLYAIPR